MHLMMYLTMHVYNNSFNVLIYVTEAIGFNFSKKYFTHTRKLLKVKDVYDFLPNKIFLRCG